MCVQLIDSAFQGINAFCVEFPFVRLSDGVELNLFLYFGVNTLLEHFFLLSFRLSSFFIYSALFNYAGFKRQPNSMILVFTLACVL